MFNSRGTTIDEIYSRCLKDLLENGEDTHPRGFNCKEISPYYIQLDDIQNNILVNPVRKASPAFMAAELLWILMGRDDVDMISFYNSKISNYSDDGEHFFGAYGPKIIAQLPYVIQTLSQDPWSRQALINIWRESPQKTKDVPCSISMHFLERPLGTLNLIVYMRSQDIWLGFPYDVHNFTSIQLIVASMIGCNPGTFTLIQGSLHMYEQDFEKAREAASFRTNVVEKTPLASNKSKISFDLKMIAVDNFDAALRNFDFLLAKHYLDGFSDELFKQKLEWLYNYGYKKHETRNH